MKVLSLLYELARKSEHIATGLNLDKENIDLAKV